MNRRIYRMLGLLTMVCVSTMVWAGPEKNETKVRVVMEMEDGSRLVGTPTASALRVKTEYMKADIPLAQIRQCEIRHKEERIVLSLENGDKLTGILDMDRFPVETILGKLSPEFAQINRMSFSASQSGGLTAGDGSIPFGGVNWIPWRTLFEVRGDKLVSLPKVRPGFNYGHTGNGRGPILMSNIGSRDWKDYSLEAELCMTGVDPSFNPYGLGLDVRGCSIFFHVADARESHNDCGNSLYNLAVDGDGNWNLSCSYNGFCRIPVGWGNPGNDGERKLADGHGLKVDPRNGNKFRIDVRGTRIQIWVDGEKIADLVDDKMGDTIGGQTLDHGGVGFQWGLDSMGWIRNFSAKRL